MAPLPVACDRGGRCLKTWTMVASSASREDDLLPDDWRSIPLISREVRLDADGSAWTSQRDPVLRERIREVYRRLCEEGESGRQLVAVHQEFTSELIALITRRNERTGNAPKQPRRKPGARARRLP